MKDGLRVLQTGEAEGVLRGGCISILAQSLGTPYAARTDDSVLFLEDIGTKPYQWDRILLHLRYSGRLDSVRGIVFGDMAQCVAVEEMEFLERAILHSLRDFEGPIAIGLRSGHVNGANVTLPLNVRVRLDVVDEENPRAGVSRSCSYGSWRWAMTQDVKHIHLIGICGTAMASLAGMLQLQGHRVTGSDAAAYPPMSDQLAGMKIRSDGALCGEQSDAAAGSGGGGECDLAREC